MRNFKIILVVAFFVVSLFLGTQYFRDAQRRLDYTSSQAVAQNLGSGINAEPFELKSLDGKVISLNSFRGKSVLLNFWATWCPPCVEELPSLLSFAAMVKQKFGVEVVAVSTDKNAEVIRAFFKQKNLWPQGELPLTILIDNDASVAGNYGSTKYPETFFLSRDLKIVRKFVGPQKWDSQEIIQWVSQHSEK